MSGSEMTAAVVSEANGPFALVQVPRPVAAAGEVLARAIVDNEADEAFRPDRVQHRPTATGEL